MKKIIFITDIHLGLKTVDVDRTQEIVQVSIQAMKHAVKLKKNGEDVIIVFGGDIFNHNDPNDYLIAQFIRILNPAVKKQIPIYILVGNHDSVARPDRKSCFSFLKKMKGGYEVVKVVDDIKTIKWFMADYGYVYLSFFPHITKAHLDGTKIKDQKEYVKVKANQIWKKVGQGQHQIVFSHLNVPEVIPGSEENLLKKSEVFLPDSFIMEKENLGYIKPIIINGHIHSRSKHKNIRIVGSPIYCGFGEKEKKKYFLEISVPENINGKLNFKYIKTDCKKFIEVKMDAFTNNGWNSWDDIAPLIPKLDKNCVVKVNAIQPFGAVIDWESIRQEIIKNTKCYVRPIVPKIMKDRVVRNQAQSIQLLPTDAVKVWMKKNNPERKKKRISMALDYIERYL